MDFIPSSKFKKAYFAAGCFWGVEYFFEKLDGVISAVSGYMGGWVKDPTYEDVCTKQSGHYEVVEVAYDESKISYEDLVKFFFEIHDFSQEDGQGPDIGPQYRSAIFYNDEKEKEIANKVIDLLKQKDYNVATKLLKKDKFYKAEEYHQDYYKKRGQKPYCHFHRRIF